MSLTVAAAIAVAKKIPPWIYISLGVVILLTASHVFTYYKGKDEGKAIVQKDWDASVERGKEVVKDLQANQGRVSLVTVTEYVDKVKVIHEKSDPIVKLIPSFLPNDLPMLPCEFRLLHDASATNSTPSMSGSTLCAPVSVADATTALHTNYVKYHELSARQVSLAEWVSRQRDLILGLCKQPGVVCTKDNLQ